MRRQSIGFAVCLAFSTLTASAQNNLNGVWSADDGGMYYVRQINNQVWWAGLSAISQLGANDIHPGIHFSNVFFGTISGNTITGDWADVPRGTILQSGTITLIVAGNEFRKTAATGGFGATTWTRQNITRTPFDVFNVFNTVRKNNAGGGSLLDNLKPAKAWPVFIFGTLKQNGSDPLLQLAYPPTSARGYWDFVCQEGGGNQDGDIDIDLVVDRTNLDTQFGFWTTGWESNHEVTADRFRAKLDSDNNHLHLESIMFGGNLNCDDSGAPHFSLPGWQNAGASGVLFNGVPIAGQLSLSSFQDKSAITSIMGRTLHAGDRIRVNGILVLDCGHSSWWPPEIHPCYEDDSSQHNQEIHPIYSIDVVQDFSRRNFFADLTGVWAANDNGTYYVRQLGNTIWWLALSSDEGHSEAAVFHGASSSDGTSFTGSWADVPLGNLAGGGALTINAPNKIKSIALSKASGGVFASHWDKLRDVITRSIIKPYPIHPSPVAKDKRKSG
jgi:hypothetical protein